MTRRRTLRKTNQRRHLPKKLVIKLRWTAKRKSSPGQKVNNRSRQKVATKCRKRISVG